MCLRSQNVPPDPISHLAFIMTYASPPASLVDIILPIKLSVQLNFDQPTNPELINNLNQHLKPNLTNCSPWAKLNTLAYLGLFFN